MIWIWLERRIGAGNAAFVVFLMVMLLLWGITSAWTRFGRDYWKGEATQARAQAATAQGNANSANAGASNASATRQYVDGLRFEVQQDTADSAERIEDHAEADPAADDRQPPDPDIVRELEDAERKARAAADRLQRARPR